MATSNTNNNSTANVNTFRFDPKTMTATKRFSVTAKAWGDESVAITAEIDFTGVAQEQVYAWASQTLIINLQQALRKCDIAFVKDLSKAVYKRKATAMGILDDPAKAYNKLMENVSSLTPEQAAQMIAALQTVAGNGKPSTKK